VRKIRNRQTNKAGDIFKKRLKALRGERSRHSVAKDLFLKDQTLEKYEKGDTLPNIEKAAEIAQYYGVSVDWLLGIEERRQSQAEFIGSICEYTGLSEKVIVLLHSLKDADDRKHLGLIDVIIKDCAEVLMKEGEQNEEQQDKEGGV
jgi:transcriptional regulator with XRE-family HTH domain